MEPGLTENKPTDNFVEVDVVVERELVGEAHVAQEGDQIADNEHQAHHSVDQDCAP